MSDSPTVSRYRPDGDTTIAELVVPPDLAELFYREARDTLGMAASNLNEAVEWDRKPEDDRQARAKGGRGKTADECAAAIDYERAKVRSADAFLAQVDEQFDPANPRELRLRAERRHLYATVQGCLLETGANEAHGAVEGGSTDEVRAAASRLERYAALLDSLLPDATDERAAA